MIEKVVRIKRMSEHNQVAEDRAYWLSKTPAERIAAVERLRRERHGDAVRLQRVARVIKRG